MMLKRKRIIIDDDEDLENVIESGSRAAGSTSSVSFIGSSHDCVSTLSVVEASHSKNSSEIFRCPLFSTDTRGNLCLIHSIINAMPSMSMRLAFVNHNIVDPCSTFLKCIHDSSKCIDPAHKKIRDEKFRIGYNLQDVREYLNHLKALGCIKNFEFHVVKKFTMHKLYFSSDNVAEKTVYAITGWSSSSKDIRNKVKHAITNACKNDSQKPGSQANLQTQCAAYANYDTKCHKNVLDFFTHGVAVSFDHAMRPHVFDNGRKKPFDISHSLLPFVDSLVDTFSASRFYFEIP